MSVQLNDAYDRERLALYVAGLLPDDRHEAEEVLKLTGELLPTLQRSREHRREEEATGQG